MRDTWESRQSVSFRALVTEIDACSSFTELGTIFAAVRISCSVAACVEEPGFPSTAMRDNFGTTVVNISRCFALSSLVSAYFATPHARPAVGREFRAYR